MSNPVVSIIIPAWNEEKNIGLFLKKLNDFLNVTSMSTEIIVVDDGSEDKTSEVALSNRVKLVRNGRNQGKGFALREGFKHACGDIIVTMDADGSHEPKEIEILVKQIVNGADMAMGSRFIGGNGKNSTKRLHLIGNSLINLSIFLATGRYITDSQTGFRACKSNVIKSLRLTSKGYQIETELTVKILRKYDSVIEVPIQALGRLFGKTHVNPLRDGLRILKVIIESATID